MLGKFDQKPRTRPDFCASPSATPLSHRGLQRRSRSILTDAAACFVATALGSLSPHALSFFEFDAVKPVVTNVDPESGKFTERVLIGGLRPISWDDSARVAPPPAFTVAASRSGADAPADLTPKPSVPAAKPAREAAPKKVERPAESKIADAAPAPAPVETAAPAPAKAEPKNEGQGISASQTVLAALTPLTASAKVAEKVWSGAKSVGGVVSGGLSWLGY